MAYLLTQAIDESAERFPDHPAFRFLATNLSYTELVAAANRLAWALRDEGVKRGDRVGIYLNKSLESAVAIYGIMKAGAAYVPLDPGAPGARVRRTLRHCGIRTLVTHDAKAQDLTTVVDHETPLESVIGIAGDLPGVRCMSWEDLEAFPEHRTPETGVMEQDMAYIMYTSGSTGTPKGIIHTHVSGLSYARMAADTYGVNCQDRLSNHAHLHFDISTFDYFAGPLRGATTLIVPETYLKLPASLSRLIEEERVTIWYSVPFALIQLLLRGLVETRDLRSLRWVLFGGEPFPPKHLNALRRLWPQARFSNVYGPAEVNQCSFYHIPQDQPEEDSPVPIGRVWPNAEGIVIDGDDRLVGRGETGELIIRAPTMMRGYWNQPHLTERAFFRRHVTPGVQDIFYRTGDLVREREDGQLLFIGRKDRQIKTRGYRVELDEIEAVLTAHPEVEEAAAYLVPGSEEDYRVEAAAILKSGSEETVDSLRSYCAEHLPWYAVPTTIPVCEAFPRTTSGKIDRNALRVLALRRKDAEYVGEI